GVRGWVEARGISFHLLAGPGHNVSGTESGLTTVTVADRMCLPPPLVEQLMQHLYREKLVEIRGGAGFNNNRYALLDRGWDQLRRVMQISAYVGPPPAPPPAYTPLIPPPPPPH